MAENMAGRVFNGRFQIKDRIGIGGMAEVYRAQDTVLGRLVAVKVMLPQYASDDNFTTRFRREAAAAANLSSPYIVNVYDWGQDQGTYYMVMEYLRGSDLKTAIKQRGPIAQRKVAEIGAQVAQALNVAHKQDIVHRDIKPQNIMIQPDGNIKVMDFGIACAKNSVISKTSAVLGTAHYISPEQAQGKELTATSDIYSLGIVLYEAATGTLPFDGPDAISVAMKQVKEQPLPPRQINPEISPVLEAIILKAMEKDPHKRFQTASEMRHALNDFLAGRPVVLDEDNKIEDFAVADRTAVMPPAQNFSYPNTVEQTAAMPNVGTATITPPQTNYLNNDDKDKKNNKAFIAIGITVALIAIAAILFFLLKGTGNVEVPDLTGKTQDEATQELEALGLGVGKIDYIYSDSVEKDLVAGQDPKPGSRLSSGDVINLSISQGVEQVTVPDLSKMTATQARQALKNAGLDYEVGTAEYSTSIDKNLVVRQDPAAGTTIAKGGAVTYFLSAGVEDSLVPYVTGMSESDAKNALKSAGFTVEVYYVENDGSPAGTVKSQTPEGNSKAAQGSSVTINVYKEIETITVPNVVGKSIGDAKALLGSDLNVTTTEATSETVAIGKVIAQSHKEGSSVEPGTTINLTVSTGPAEKNNKPKE